MFYLPCAESRSSYPPARGLTSSAAFLDTFARELPGLDAASGATARTLPLAIAVQAGSTFTGALSFKVRGILSSAGRPGPKYSVIFFSGQLLDAEQRAPQTCTARRYRHDSARHAPESSRQRRSPPGLTVHLIADFLDDAGVLVAY